MKAIKQQWEKWARVKWKWARCLETIFGVCISKSRVCLNKQKLKIKNDEIK